MNCALQESAAKVLKRVSYVHNDGVFIRFDIFPPVLGLYLQSGNGLVEEESQRIVIGVTDSPGVVERLVLCNASRVILHIAQVFQSFGIIAVAGCKIVFIYFEDVGEES